MSSNCCQTCACRANGHGACNHWSHGTSGCGCGGAPCNCSGGSGNQCPPGPQGPPGPPGSPGTPGSGDGPSTVPAEAYQRCYQGDSVNWPNVPDVSGTWGLTSLTSQQGSDVSEVCVVWRLANETEVYVIPKTQYIPQFLEGVPDPRGNIDDDNEIASNEKVKIKSFCTVENPPPDQRYSSVVLQKSSDDNVCGVKDRLTNRIWETSENIGTALPQLEALFVVQTCTPTATIDFVKCCGDPDPWLLGDGLIYFAYNKTTFREYWFFDRNNFICPNTR